MSDFDEGDVEVGRASVHWRWQGSGPPAVFLHGFPLSGRTWDPVIRHLRDRFTCYAPDLIGLGESHSGDGEDHSSPGQARALRVMLSELGVESHALIGNDSGGWVARELALLDPKRVSHLVLTNTEIPGHRPPWIPTYQALAHVPGSGALVRRLLGSRTFRRSSLGLGNCFHDLAHLDGEFHRRVIAPLLAAPERIHGAMAFLRHMKFSRLDEFRGLHGQLTMPTLFIWGADDPFFPEARGREMIRQFPNVTGFHSIRDAKLFFYEEHPQEVAGLIGRFLG